MRRMTDAEKNLTNIESSILVNQSAIDNSKRTLRELQAFKIYPDTQSESILFAGVDIDKEIQRVTDHILFLMEIIERKKSEIFKHKLMFGEDE